MFMIKRYAIISQSIFLRALPNGKTQDSMGYTPIGVTVKMSTKIPKGKESIDDQKEANRSISSFRVLVEPAIGGAKSCRNSQR